jgi:hypothetical protein
LIEKNRDDFAPFVEDDVPFEKVPARKALFLLLLLLRFSCTLTTSLLLHSIARECAKMGRGEETLKFKPSH